MKFGPLVQQVGKNCVEGMVDTALLLAWRMAAFTPIEVHRIDISVLATLETVARKL